MISICITSKQFGVHTLNLTINSHLTVLNVFMHIIGRTSDESHICLNMTHIPNAKVGKQMSFCRLLKTDARTYIFVQNHMVERNIIIH